MSKIWRKRKDDATAKAPYGFIYLLVPDIDAAMSMAKLQLYCRGVSLGPDGNANILPASDAASSSIAQLAIQHLTERGLQATGDANNAVTISPFGWPTQQ